ncbi:MAG: tetratricopeptide repeat protein [candidate division Zixibacteria bacterium]|nr:tetratricopeptide repeat protein [candidate division Zixibacteria bacterium]MBU1471805.1 tetratricopeptide repeat protein [candidate division Zixibacteria bacterium]MBU2626893.1 tetratricopeptide repeat protein [candidate division Zixibacteria bacterium]
MLEATGEIIGGKFKVLSQDEGGMGRVYVCQGPDGDRKFVLKTLLDRFMSNQHALSRFIQEARIWVSLGDIPNVIAAYDVEMLDGRPFVIAEYGGSWNLRGWLNKHQVSTIEGIDIAIDIANGMKNAMTLVPSIIHGDLTPDNIILKVWWGCELETQWLIDNADAVSAAIANTSDELERVEKLSEISGKSIEERILSVNVTDFGLAKIADDESYRRYANTRVRKEGFSGKPRYLSPEQCSGQPVQQQSDVYTFGIVLYELMTGHWPYETEANLSVFACHEGAKPTDPLIYNSNIPPQIHRLVLQCLEKDPGNRPRGFSMIFEALSTSRIVISEAPADLKERLAAMIRDGLDLNIAESLREGKAVARVSFEKPSPVVDLGWQETNTLIKKALLEISLGNDSEGIALLDKVLESDPTNIEAAVRCSNRLFEAGSYDLALQYSGRALDIDSANVEAMFVKANALAKLNRPEEAIELYKACLVKSPDSTEMLTNIGSTYCDSLNDPAEALNYFNRALEINAAFVPALIGKGASLGHQGHFEKAISCYDRILELDPKNAHAALHKGGILCDALGWHTDALEIFDGVIASNRLDAWAWYHRGVALEKMRQYDMAVSSYHEAYRLDHRVTDALFNIAVILANHRQFTDAIKYLDMLLAAVPEDKQAASLRERCQEFSSR